MVGECQSSSILKKTTNTTGTTPNRVMTRNGTQYTDSCKSVLKFADDGSGNGTGTSLTATRVSASTCETGNDIFGLAYSTFNSCACDNVSSESGSASAYLFNYSHGITLNSCGAENVTGTVLQMVGSEVVVNGFFTYNINGVLGQTHAYLWFEASKVVLNCCYFADFTIANDSYNMVVQVGSYVSFNQCRVPSGGNRYISYSNGSVVFYIDSTGVTAKVRIDDERAGIVSNGKRIFWDSGSPSAGAWVKGDVIYNTAPVAGGYIGWVCVSGGHLEHGNRSGQYLSNGALRPEIYQVLIP